MPNSPKVFRQSRNDSGFSTLKLLLAVVIICIILIVLIVICLFWNIILFILMMLPSLDTDKEAIDKVHAQWIEDSNSYMVFSEQYLKELEKLKEQLCLVKSQSGYGKELFSKESTIEDRVKMFQWKKELFAPIIKVADEIISIPDKYDHYNIDAETVKDFGLYRFQNEMVMLLIYDAMDKYETQQASEAAKSLLNAIELNESFIITQKYLIGYLSTRKRLIDTYIPLILKKYTPDSLKAIGNKLEKLQDIRTMFIQKEKTFINEQIQQMNEEKSEFWYGCVLCIIGNEKGFWNRYRVKKCELDKRIIHSLFELKSFREREKYCLLDSA